jgi:hypothetical protein
MALARYAGFKLDNHPPVSDGQVSRRDVSPGRSLKCVMGRVLLAFRQSPSRDHFSIDIPDLSDLTSRSTHGILVWHSELPGEVAPPTNLGYSPFGGRAFTKTMSRLARTSSVTSPF